MIYERKKLMLDFHKTVLKENKKTSETRRKYWQIECLIKTCIQNIQRLWSLLPSVLLVNLMEIRQTIWTNSFTQKPYGWQMSTWGEAPCHWSSGKCKLEFQRLPLHTYWSVWIKICCVNSWLESGVLHRFPVAIQDDTTTLVELAVSLKVKCIIIKCPHSLFLWNESTETHTQVHVSFNCHNLKQETAQMLTDMWLAKETMEYCLTIKKNEFITTS